MGYAILRLAKLKTRGQIAASLGHNLREKGKREKFYPHADPERMYDNTFFAPFEMDGRKVLMPGNSQRSNVYPEMDHHNRVTRFLRQRADSVQMLEFLITASPEAMEKMSRYEQDEYLTKALKWITKRHGFDNIVSAAIHRDEKTPHLHVHVIPVAHSRLKNGREVLTLSHNKWYGSRGQLRDLQTDFANEVAADFGLLRGEERSRAEHTDLKKWRSMQKQEAVYVQEKIDSLEDIVTDTKSRRIIANAITLYSTLIEKEREIKPSQELEKLRRDVGDVKNQIFPQLTKIAEKENARRKKRNIDRGMEL